MNLMLSFQGECHAEEDNGESWRWGLVYVGVEVQ